MFILMIIVLKEIYKIDLPNIGSSVYYIAIFLQTINVDRLIMITKKFKPS